MVLSNFLSKSKAVTVIYGSIVKLMMYGGHLSICSHILKRARWSGFQMYDIIMIVLTLAPAMILGHGDITCNIRVTGISMYHTYDIAYDNL